jgi:RNA 2',3'-cyclic 3'-phosphodiesterase
MTFDPDVSLRLFFGLTLTDEVRLTVVALQQRLRNGGARVKWVEPENLHFTLRFLGEMPALMVRDLKATAKPLAAEMQPWSLTLQGLEAFPSVHAPQTIYAEVTEGAAPLTRLARKLNRALEEVALVEPDRRPFVAHCTLGRVKQAQGLAGLVAALEAEADASLGAMTCLGFSLLSSQLTERGPVYTEIASFAFGPEPQTPA